MADLNINAFAAPVVARAPAAAPAPAPEAAPANAIAAPEEAFEPAAADAPVNLQPGAPMSAQQLEALGAEAKAKRSKLFADTAPLGFKLTSDFTRISSQKDALKKAETVIPSTVELNGQSSPAELKVRGESSTWDLPLPKLKLKIPEGNGLDPFKGKQKVELGVHGNIIGNPAPVQWSGMGRQLDDFAPRREALAYAVLEDLGLPSPATRVGVADYVDTKGDADPANDASEAKRSVLMVESVDDMAKRWGGKELEREDFQNGATFKARKEDWVLMQMAELLMGNRDVSFPNAPGGEDFITLNGAPHNGKIIQLSDGWARTVPTDFDLCAWTLAAGSQQSAQWSGAANETFDGLAGHINQLPAAAQRPFLERLLGRKDAVLSRIANYPLQDGDPQRQYLLDRTTRFFDVVKQQLDARPA